MAACATALEGSLGFEQARQAIREAEGNQNNGLEIAGLNLKRLPESLAKLTQLQELSLNRNQLTTLPEAITQLTQLQTLSLDRNQLATLPEAITQLTCFFFFFFFFFFFGAANAIPQRQSVDHVARGHYSAHPAANAIP